MKEKQDISAKQMPSLAEGTARYIGGFLRLKMNDTRHNSVYTKELRVPEKMNM